MTSLQEEYSKLGREICKGGKNVSLFLKTCYTILSSLILVNGSISQKY